MSIEALESVRTHLNHLVPPGILIRPIEKGLEQLNSLKAEHIALFVRQYGIYRFGPMLAKFRGALPDGRDIFLQASDEAMEVKISRFGRHAEEHARWDRARMAVNTLEQRDAHKALLFYQTSMPGERIPKTLTRFDVIRDFSILLGQIEQVAHPTVPDINGAPGL